MGEVIQKKRSNDRPASKDVGVGEGGVGAEGLLTKKSGFGDVWEAEVETALTKKVKDAAKVFGEQKLGKS